MATTDILRPRGTSADWSWDQICSDIDVADEVAAGAADHELYRMDAGMHTQDVHIDELMVTLENAPGGGKTVTVTVSNGVSTITVAITEGNTASSSTTNNFDWDASAQDLLVKYTSTAGTATGHMTIHVAGHEILITA